MKVYISNDSRDILRAIMTVKVMDFSGNLYSDEIFTVDIPRLSSLVYYDTLVSAVIGRQNPKDMLLLVALKGIGLFPWDAKNILYFVPPKDLNLPVPSIEKSVTATPEGYTVRLTCDKLVKNVFLSTTVKGEFSDNYFDMLPGESVEVKFTSTKRNPKMADLIIVKSLVDTY
jgi:beta-mannosidase